MLKRVYVWALLLTAIACGGKGSGSSNSSPTSPSSGSTTSSATMFEGTIAGTGGQSGAFSVTIQTAIAASSVVLRAVRLTITPESFTQVSGTLNVAGGPNVTLTGTYDSSANAVNLSGGGFTLTGTITGAVLSGTYTGPSGNGEFSSLNSTQTSVTAYCGTYQSGDGAGAFNIDIAATGAVSGATSQGCLLTGQLTGNTVTMSCGGGGGGAAGTVQNGTVSGTVGAAGTFSGSSAACSVPAPPPAASGLGLVITTNSSPGSFTASLQNEALTATGDYNFILAPGAYTMSGQVLGVGGEVSGGSYTLAGLSIGFHMDPTCKGSSGCAGVASGVQSSITGGLGTQSVSSCQVAYNTLNPGCLPNPPGATGCNSPTPSLNFQLQFTVTQSPPVCQ